MKRQLKFGLFVTALWLGIGVLYIWQVAGFERFLDPTIGVIGDFFAGIFAPLAFLWLVIGYFQQGEELRLQRTELKLQRQQLSLQRKETRRLADEAGRQAQAVEANELHARKDTFLRIAELTTDELNSIVIATINNLNLTGDLNDAFRRHSSGDKDAFFKILIYRFSEEAFQDSSVKMLKGLPNWHEDIFYYCRKFENLLRMAEDCDPEGQFREHFDKSKMGQLYTKFQGLLNDYVAEKVSQADG